MIKREVLVDGELISWAESENVSSDEMGKFVVFQDKSAKKRIWSVKLIQIPYERCAINTLT